MNTVPPRRQIAPPPACRMERFAWRRGAVTVEFGLVAAVALLLMFTSVELARINVIRHTADNAAYEAARRAAVPHATAQDAIDRAVGILRAVGARGSQVAVHPAEITNDTLQVTVTVTVPLDRNGWIAARFSRGRHLVRQCTMPREALQ